MNVPMPLLAAISGDAILSGLIWIIIMGVVFGLLWWLINYISLPEPFAKVARVILALAAVLLLINVLLGWAGHPLVEFRR